jgi:hypothetical protein
VRSWAICLENGILTLSISLARFSFGCGFFLLHLSLWLTPRLAIITHPSRLSTLFSSRHHLPPTPSPSPFLFWPLPDAPGYPNRLLDCSPHPTPTPVSRTTEQLRNRPSTLLQAQIIAWRTTGATTAIPSSVATTDRLLQPRGGWRNSSQAIASRG